MYRFLCLVLCFALFIPMAGCASPESTETVTPELTASGEPAFITVQHVLIGFEGSVRGKNVSRSKQDAEKLATKLLGKAQAGEDFGSLVKAYTDDSPPGIYHMSNLSVKGVMPGLSPSDQIYPRDQMVAAFGDVGFPLKVGEVGMAPHHDTKSPFGWHIIKRLK